jgi:hypothetical protein
MDNPGAFTLGDFTLTTPGTQLGAPVCDLAGMRAVALQVRFAYGSGGATCAIYIQTSIDQGQTWFDVACMAFATAPGLQATSLTTGAPLSGLITPGDGVLAVNTILNGILGDRLQAKVVSTGTYGNSTAVNVRAVAQ